MGNWIRRGSVVLIVFVAVSAFVASAVAEGIELPGTSWSLGGNSRLKVKKIGKFEQVTFGNIGFGTNDEFLFALEDLFTLAGTYQCSRRRCVLTPDPDSLEDALASLLEGTIFDFALRGVQPGNVKFKIKLKTKKDTDFVKVRLKINFEALLALNQENPDDPEAEVIEPFRMKFRFKGTSPLGQG